MEWNCSHCCSPACLPFKKAEEDNSPALERHQWCLLFRLHIFKLEEKQVGNGKAPTFGAVVGKAFPAAQRV